MGKFTLCLKLFLVSIFCIVLCAFSKTDTVQEYVEFLQRSFTVHYDSSQEISNIKKYELNVTNNGFCRYKKFFNNGKIEYFAFKLSKFRDLDYYGTTVSGRLYLRTKNDDVIVQTYNDRAGDVDSMAAFVVIPIRNIEAEDLTQIKETLAKISPSDSLKKN